MANEKRLIDADRMAKAVLDAEKIIRSESNCYYDIGWADALSAVANKMKTMPTVDAVEVVRCKDCKHYKPQRQSAHWEGSTLYCCRCTTVKVKADDFCSYGERRTDD